MELVSDRPKEKHVALLSSRAHVDCVVPVLCAKCMVVSYIYDYGSMQTCVYTRGASFAYVLGMINEINCSLCVPCNVLSSYNAKP